MIQGFAGLRVFINTFTEPDSLLSLNWQAESLVSCRVYDGLLTPFNHVATFYSQEEIMEISSSPWRWQ